MACALGFYPLLIDVFVLDLCAELSKWSFPGFDVSDVPTDGNCLFSSVSHQLHMLGVDSMQRRAEDIRTELVEVLESHSQLAAQVAQGLDKGLKF